MPLKLYTDHHVPRAITIGLRLRQVDVVTAYEDQAHEIADTALLDRATALGRVLFTQDDDLLAEATHRQRTGIAFGGVIYAHQQDVSIGQCVEDLEMIAAAGTEADVRNRVMYLPLSQHRIHSQSGEVTNPTYA
ncbi:MAG: DUF5615 family PIN-like protein [Kouleothrix sp.]|jgi:predicted nuclease of predicted toxin-antitoxin system|nr:DUF5615 family PIN-like protein [Kouleothrix sp.]